MDNCIFCKIINKEVGSDIVYEDDSCIIIKDLHPKAKIHLLLIPKSHYARLEEASVSEAMELSFMINKLSTIKNDLGLQNGYRLIINQGEDGGQEVQHLHVHILGGEKLPDFK